MATAEILSTRHWFDDPDIEDQETVVCQRADDQFEVGVSILVRHPSEVILTRDELLAALGACDAERKEQKALGNRVV